MRTPWEQLGLLADTTEKEIGIDGFARDNFFNNLGGQGAHLRVDTPPHITFGHVVRIELAEVNPDLDKHLEDLAEEFRTLREPLTGFDHDTRLERILTAFDAFLFDRYQDTFLVQSEMVADFGRFAVRRALDLPTPEKVA